MSQTLNKSVYVRPIERYRAQAPRHSFSTPNALICAFALIFIVTASAAWSDLKIISGIRMAFTTLGVSTEPSVVIAERVKATLADIDASVMNDALLSGKKVGEGTDYRNLQNTIDLLQSQASQNITVNTERSAILGIFQATRFYYENVASAKASFQSNEAIGVEKIQAASDILYGPAMKSAEDLRLINIQELEQSYNNFIKSKHSIYFWIVLNHFLIVITLFAVQFVLHKRMKRIANPFLALAFILSVLSGFALFTLTTVQINNFEKSKTNAFDSIDSLYQVKTIFYRMNAKESLWMLNQTTRSESEKDFKDNLAKILIPKDTNQNSSYDYIVQQLDGALSLEKTGHSDQAIRATPKIGGLLGRAVENITFGVEEREPLTEAVKYFAYYVAIDNQIRVLENNGKHEQALAMVMGKARGESDWAFDQSINAINRAIETNEQQFTQNISSGLSKSTWMNIWAFMPLSLEAVFCGIGIFLLYQRSGAKAL